MRVYKKAHSISRRALAIAVAAAAMGGASNGAADDLEEVTFGTNWYAQAEHGGFYQAVAEGIYEDYGLDVSIEMGGPQVNNTQLLAAGTIDFSMGYPVDNYKAVQEGVPIVTVGGTFQADPQVIIAQPEVETLEELRGERVAIASAAHTTFWPWLKAEYGFSDDMVATYDFSVAPFLAGAVKAQQGYVSSEPFQIQREGVEPTVFLLADYGYPPYAQTLETTQEMVEQSPDIVSRFVEASMKGWQSYLDNPEPGNALIVEDNPEMTQEQIEFGIQQMDEYELVVGGDAQEHGIGVMTDARWQELYDFLVSAELISDEVDVDAAYTLEFLPEEPVLP